MIRRMLALCLLLAMPLSAQESVVAGLSDTEVSIATDFTGSEILIFGAVKRETPIATDAPLQVIITVKGPPGSAVVRRKNRNVGIWRNTEKARFAPAPTFYAVATSAPLRDVLSQTEDLRHGISLNQVIRKVGTASAVPDPDNFVAALMRLRSNDGLYQLQEGGVSIEESTLFRTRIAMPANIAEGVYQTRILLTRDGKVIDLHEVPVTVGKVGFERWLFRLAQDQPALYGLLALALAVFAGWAGSALFRFLRW